MSYAEIAEAAVIITLIELSVTFTLVVVEHIHMKRWREAYKAKASTLPNAMGISEQLALAVHTSGNQPTELVDDDRKR